jgi:hypothetical protein
VRRLRGGAGRRAQPAAQVAVGGHRRGSPDPRPGAAAPLAGRVRLSQLRAPRRAARARPVHARGHRSTGRSRLRVPRQAGDAAPHLALRRAVHARELRARAARPRGRRVDVQSDRRDLERRRRRPPRARGRQAGRQRGRRRGVRRPEPGPARAGGRHRPHRHARDAHARRGAGARCGGSPQVSLLRAGAGRGRGHKAERRASAAVPASRPGAGARARAHRARGGGRPARAGGDRADRLRRARVRLSHRDRRTAEAGRRARRARGDSSAVRARRHAVVVARHLRGGVRARAVGGAVAHRTRRRLARGRRLEHDRSAALHRVAAAVVCDLAASASRCQPQRPPARRHSRVLRVRAPDPPGARRPAAQPAAAAACASPPPRAAGHRTPHRTHRFPGYA